MINVIKNVAENILKYKDFIIEIYSMWYSKAKVIPEIVGATGSSHNHSDNTPAKYRQCMESRNYKNSHISHCKHF